MLRHEIQIRIHFRWSTSISLIFDKQLTLNSELSNFDNDSVLQWSHCCGLSTSVLWTMIIHARFLIKTCHHASHFYALNKHNYLCICLEIFLSKCKPLARVDPIIYWPLTNWCESPCKKAFWCGYNKDKMSTRVTWAKCWILFFFVSLHFLLLKWTTSRFTKTERYFQRSVICVSHSPVIPLFALIECVILLLNTIQTHSSVA